jgi:hypothetical protein
MKFIAITEIKGKCAREGTYVLFLRTDFLAWQIFLIKKLDFEETNKSGLSYFDFQLFFLQNFSVKEIC